MNEADAPERLSQGAPSFFVRDGKSLLMFHEDHHGDGQLAIWCAAPRGAQPAAVPAGPESFCVPPSVGHRGWIGARLDLEPNWDEIAEFIADAHTCIASPRARPA